jgi:hypothetical protein
MGSAASSFIVDNAIIGLAQPLTEAHGNNDDRDSMQRRFPHDGFLSSRLFAKLGIPGVLTAMSSALLAMCVVVLALGTETRMQKLSVVAA